MTKAHWKNGGGVKWRGGVKRSKYGILLFSCLFVSFLFFFNSLVADTQLYRRLCPSIGPSVSPFVCEHESKSRKVSALDACVWLGGVGPKWGLDAPAHPSATIL